MAKVSTYLNFPDTTEEAFQFYQSVFGGEFVGGIHRMGEVPPQEGKPALSEKEKNLVMHIALPILGGHMLMGTDAPESMGFKAKPGKNMYINLEPDTKEEAERLFTALSLGGKVETPFQKMFWGAYFASFWDKYGIGWMVNVEAK